MGGDVESWVVGSFKTSNTWTTTRSWLLHGQWSQNNQQSGHGSLSLEEKTSSTFQDLTSLTSESEKPQRRAHSVIIRPNDPLIESVASHDKSKKVPELVHASAMPNRDERGSFLEQIKNKSFSLKPTVAPTMKFKGGPPTNLKVIAILEKANAIRQACAGSDDDDDDDDSWN